MNSPTKLSTDQILPSLDSDFLRTFVAIAELGSFSKAARQVFRTPSAVSMQIKKLEEMLDTSLFKRDSRSVELTYEGEILLGYARRILALNYEVLSRFLKPAMSGTVRLGSPEDYSSRLLPIILKKFSETHPHVTVDVVIDASESLIERYERGDLDVTLMTSAPNSPLMAEQSVVLEESIVWVGLKGGQAWQQNPVPVTMWEAGCAWRDRTVESLEDAGKEYRVAYMSANSIAQRAAVMADLAIAAFPASFIDPPLTRLGKQQGLPDPGNYQIRMLARSDLDPVGEAVRDHVISSFEAFKAGELECCPV